MRHFRVGWVLPIIGSVIGIFTGNKAKTEILNSAGTQSGDQIARGGVIVGDMGDILLLPLKMLLTMLLLVSCCFFCRIVSAKVSTFLIFAALFSKE